MPLYEYGCSKCHKTSEHLLKMSDPHPEECPLCHATKTLTKKLSKTSFILKGGGWYTDAYSDKAKPAKADKSEGASAGGTDAKTETKSETTTTTTPASTTKPCGTSD